jgi:polar amino acid transport system substrate-binding protein
MPWPLQDKQFFDGVVMSCLFVASMVLLVFSQGIRGDALDDARARGCLRWGGDQEGGGPYIYPSPDNPRKLLGFEVELMEALAVRLGVRAEFHQCEWTNLPDLLRTGGIDVIANGYELTPAHRRTKLASIPYYVYELQLLGRKRDASISSWSDLKTKTPAKTVGVLAGSGAETYVRRLYGDTINIRLYSGSTDAMLDVQNRNIDVTVQDIPATTFYRNRFAGLQAVDTPAGRGYYVLYVRPHDQRLKERLDAGLLDLIQSGQLRSLYERYGIWTKAQERLATPGLGLDVGEKVMEVRGWEAVWRNLPILLESAGVSVLLTLLSMPLAILVGLMVALGRLYGPRPLSGLLTGYVEVLRGTPLLLQLFSIYYVLPPALGWSLNPLSAAVIGLALNYSAYESEIYRAGLLAIPPGQMEAALALGMSRGVALRRVIVPQAVRLVIPPVTNDFIALFKDTSICSVITVVELTKRYSILVNNTSAYLELMLVTATLYLLMSYPLSLLARRLENKQRSVT